jgi:hypothetical protein
MSDVVVSVTVIVGFGFVIVAGAHLGAGTHRSLAGLFPASGVRDWPQGVQEGDAPRFAVAHLDGLRPDQPMTVAVVPCSAEDPIATPPTELVDLGSRRLG